MAGVDTKFCSWNVRGVNHPIKRKKILTLLKKEGVKIALLQETHLKDIEHIKLKREWVGQVFFSSFTSNSRGVCILIHKSLPFKVEKCIRDEGGRYVMVKGLLFGERISIMNIYYPPNHPTELITKAFTEFADIECEQSIIGGDFNCLLDPQMDKSPSEIRPPTKRARAIIELCEELGYLDIWRATHPGEKDFSFFSSVHKSSSRIDYFFIPKAKLNLITSCSIGNITISDHSPIFLQLLHEGGTPPTRMWRFNSSLLSDPKFISYFTSEFKIFYEINNTPDISPSTLWETSKAYSRGLIISYASSKRRKACECQRELESQLSEAEKSYVTSPSETNLKTMSAVKASLNSLLTHKAEQSIRFARQKLYEFGNKPSKYLARLVSKKADSQCISAIKDADGKRRTDAENINKAFEKCYSQLYRSEQPVCSQRFSELFFSNLNRPKFTDLQKETLNKPITEQEIREALGSLQSGKAPGPDGLGCEFYKEFKSLLIQPLLNMYHHSLENGFLPRSLTEANISLILKKGKADDDCASFRPISLLNTDLKLLSKILALRLETVLPSIINKDQTGFITGRNSCNNMRRLLNVIQLSQSGNVDCVVVSLDAEKAFDRVEWPYLFSTLETLGLGEAFIGWVKLLYNNPLSAVLTNGRRSSYFRLGRGTRQGCPLSPLLFAIAIEPLAEAIRHAPSISGISAGDKTHKMSLYADDVLLFLTKPEVSIPAVLDLISCFSEFSGYKINFSKSEALPLGGLRDIPPPVSCPFRWAVQGFTYLGIVITPLIQQLYKANFTPLLKRIYDDLERWISLPLSMLGRISLIKMNILPKLLYVFQMLPIIFSRKVIKEINSRLSTFIWRGKKPRMSLARLMKPQERGGLSVPDVRLYQLASQLRYISDWIQNDSDSVWLDLESSQVNRPLRGLLFTSDQKKSKTFIGDNMIINATIKAWRNIRKLEGLEGQLSSLSPVWGNIDFSPGATDRGFKLWDSKGMVTIGHLYDKEILLSFDQLCKKYDLPRNEFFRHLQIQSFLNSQKDTGLCHQPSPLEKIVSAGKTRGILGLGYRALSKYDKGKPAFTPKDWNNDLNINTDEATWSLIWQSANDISICNRTKETQFRLLQRLQITPQLRHKMDHNKSEMCTKCITEVGSFVHCVWTCRYIDDYWKGIVDKIHLILGVTLDKDPMCLLFGLPDKQLKSMHSKRLLCILTFCARKNILLKWIDCKPPTIAGWHKVIFDMIPMEYLTYRSKCKIKIFYRIWSPFLDYIGTRLAAIVMKGLVDYTQESTQD